MFSVLPALDPPARKAPSLVSTDANSPVLLIRYWSGNRLQRMAQRLLQHCQQVIFQVRNGHRLVCPLRHQLLGHQTGGFGSFTLFCRVVVDASSEWDRVTVDCQWAFFAVKYGQQNDVGCLPLPRRSFLELCTAIWDYLPFDLVSKDRW